MPLKNRPSKPITMQNIIQENKIIQEYCTYFQE